MEEKREYHEPELRSHGKVTDTTRDEWDEPYDADDILCWS